MESCMLAHKVSSNVYWVGAIDWNVRDFHGYKTQRGSTYNAYLITGSKNILIDTVKRPFYNEMIERISSVISPSQIDYVISNHAEMDHSGSLDLLLEDTHPKKVYVSTMGKKALQAHFHDRIDFSLFEVVSNKSLDIDEAHFEFVDTKMLHWPDSMMSYYKNDGVLFCQDGFGMHLASRQRFFDELDPSLLYEEASRYYANILLPFSSIVESKVDSLLGLGLDIKIMAPDHGPIYRRNKDIETIIDCYRKWAKQSFSKRVSLVYDTMWNSTEKMARSIEDGINSMGVLVHTIKMKDSHRSDLAADILESGVLVVGSPTINRNIYPTIADAMCYLKGLSPKNKLAYAFGSYGWSGEAVSILGSYFDEMKLERKEDLKVNYVPGREDLVKCFNFGIKIAQDLISKLS